MCKKCICFARVSSSRQDYQAQINAVKKAAIADNYKEDEIEVVVGKESAIKKTEEERQTLNEMKKIIEENPSIESVYCFAIDRIARRVSVVLSIKDYLLKHGINLVFLYPRKMETIRLDENGNKIEDEVTNLLLMMLSYGAQMEMKIKTERAVTKKAEMKENNEVIAKLIFGYVNVNRHAEIDPTTAPIVKWIFKAYNDNKLSLCSVFDEGVKLGYWKHLASKSSRASKIRQILMNYSYCGLPTESGFVYPKLIEKEEIDKAIELMKQARYKPKQSAIIALAKGKIRDRKSGYAMVYSGNHMSYETRANDDYKRVNMNIVDFLVWREASRVKWNLLSSQDANRRDQLVRDISQIDTKIENLQQLIDTEINERFNKVYKAYINSRGRISDSDYEREVTLLNKEEKKYKEQIDSFKQSKAELLQVLADFDKTDKKYIDPISVMSITDFALQKEIADEVIDKIEVDTNELGQIIYIYNKYEAEPQVYCNKGRTRRAIIYYLLNRDADAIDISDEYKLRYKRKNR